MSSTSGDGLITWFDPSPNDAELPARLNSPFDVGVPHPLVQRAIDALVAELRTGVIAAGVPTACLHGPEGGKMFGVLVVRARTGAVGFLKAFSGQLEQRWDVPGYVPPVFDRVARASVEPPGERTVKALTARVDAVAVDPARLELLADAARLEAAHEAMLEHLRADAAEHKRERHQRRQGASPDELRALDRESQLEDLELKRKKRGLRAERAALDALLQQWDRRERALERLRRVVSQEVSRQLYDTYVFENARGQQRSLRALFEPKLPSSGTGDCAAPKLLVHARRHGLEALGIAELWWGAPPPGGGRVEGTLFPACKEKCGPVLSFLLEGADVEPRRRHRPRDVADDELVVRYEDDALIVFDKPEGLLSVPGTDATVVDSLLARARRRHPTAQLVHRLDLETSGLVLVALSPLTYVALQRQFVQRTVQKEYVALLEGLVERDEGQLELPLRVDLEQRPRQVVDFEHGRPALTRFAVVERAMGRTRVRFFPHTGRTHQLRVHASHALGLSTPIVGDRLYGRPDRRLMLHAHRLTFAHPVGGQPISVESAVPF